jgi:transcriptional regulator with XRE-family HTH domain
MTTRIGMPAANHNPLGAYLKDRRTKLDPAAFGVSPARRRTPGLRREEVAQRANISATWYTWLEQGRGGAPSADVLERIARALMLTDVEPEHLFLLGLGRPPEVRYRRNEGVTPRLQRLLDVVEPYPGSHQDRDMGRGGVEPGGDRDAERLRLASAGAAHPALHLP